MQEKNEKIKEALATDRVVEGIMHNDIIFWIWLSEQLRKPSRDFRNLIIRYGGAYEIFQLDGVALERIEGITQRTRQDLSNKDLTSASRILAECEAKGIGVVTYVDEAYPARLRDIQNPPVVLYYKGTLPDFNRRLCIGMVGTRNMSQYGLCTAYQLSYELASAGALVVSGMATGIDGVSAASAMLAGGDTVAILGCGVDVVYPRHHAHLRDEIAAHGAVMSEYAPGVRPNHYHFPARNRIISGMTQGTLVVEAGLGSGSLITAKDAVMQGRDLFAVPANLNNEGAQGTNGLLRDGAHLVLATEDILSHYGLYDDVLDFAALEEAHKCSRVNMRALEAYGVIELIKRTEQKTESPSEAYPAPRRERTPRKPRETARREIAEETVKRTPSEETLRTLTPAQLAVLQAIPDDSPISTDALGRLEYPYGEIISALTFLEIKGLIKKLPGALYTKV